MTHICVDNLTIIGSDNGLSPGRRQAIIWTNVGILLIEPLGTSFSEILTEIIAFSVKNMHLKTSSAKWRLFCLGINELTHESLRQTAGWHSGHCRCLARNYSHRTNHRSASLAKSHYNDFIMGAIASQITNLTIVYSTVYSDAGQRNIKAPRHWPLCGEFTGGRRIPRLNGQ